MKSLTKVAPGPSEGVQALTRLVGNKTEKKKKQLLDLTPNNHSAPCLNLGSLPASLLKTTTEGAPPLLSDSRHAGPSTDSPEGGAKGSGVASLRAP